MDIYLENSSAPGKNISESAIPIHPWNVVICSFIVTSFLVGTTLNSLFLWVIGVKMKRTVNTVWYFHLILTYLLSSVNMPFIAVDTLLDHQWDIGLIPCKLLNTFGSIGMFTTVFLLTIISLDRYLLICHPIWSQHNRTVTRAQRLIKGVWLVSLVLNAPYLAFRETQKVKDHTRCINNYALSNDWDGAEINAQRHYIHLGFFVFRFLFTFFFPFLIIMGCYCWMGQKMKKKRLSRTGKPYRVLMASVASFFVYWIPYHVYQGSKLLEDIMPQQIIQAFLVLFFVGGCFNYIFTPILYLFVGEKFQQVFKMSIFSLLKRGFTEDLPSGYVSKEASQVQSQILQEAYSG